MSTDGYFAQLMDFAPDALVVFDQTRLIRYVNRRAEQLFGYDRDELHNGPFSQLAELSLSHLPDGETPNTLAIQAKHKAGRRLPLEVAIARIDAPPGVLFSAAFRGGRPPRAKAEFLANMSHELRSPLNVIIGFAKLMYRGRVGTVSDPQREYLGDILDSAEHLLQLVNDLVDLSKLDAGRMDIQPEPVDLALLLHELQQSLDKDTLSKLIPLDVSVAPECDAIELDPDKLKQALVNILCHALPLAAAGRRIQLHAHLDSDEQLRIEIRWQIAPNETPPTRQSLSLALAQRLVEQQGGRVSDQPSAYIVVLPRKPGMLA
ncbi:MAG TPA: PAS domain-containing sensor histidine kinase [Polyangiales bacterium]|nr:PAS domain-containing sensor histidine kinase [Polyangiales bacterium]